MLSDYDICIYCNRRRILLNNICKNCKKEQDKED